MAFYLLARSIEAIQLISNSPILQDQSFSQQFMQVLVDIIALLMPNMGRFTNSDWLIYGVDWSAFGLVILQTLIYSSIIISAGIFDLYRKNF